MAITIVALASRASHASQWAAMPEEENYAIIFSFAPRFRLISVSPPPRWAIFADAHLSPAGCAAPQAAHTPDLHDDACIVVAFILLAEPFRRCMRAWFSVTFWARLSQYFRSALPPYNFHFHHSQRQFSIPLLTTVDTFSLYFDNCCAMMLT